MPNGVTKKPLLKNPDSFGSRGGGKGADIRQFGT